MIAHLLAAGVMLAGPGDPTPVFTVQDPRIDENSGMVDLGGGLTAITNDSGNPGVVYVVDSHGRTVGTTSYGDQVDVEALAPAGAGEVWVGDTGDNDRDRRDVVLRKVPVGRGDRTVSVPAYRLTYPDGPHDAETLLRQPGSGRLYVVTKALFGGAVYAVPRDLSAAHSNRMRKVAPVSIFATDGAFLSDGRTVLVRGYTGLNAYAFPGFRLRGSTGLPVQQQGEAVSVGPRDRVRIGSEGVRQPVLQVNLPAGLRPAEGSSSTPTSPSRAGDTGGGHRQDDVVRDRAVRSVPWILLTLALVVVVLAGLVVRGRRHRRRRGEPVRGSER